MEQPKTVYERLVARCEAAFLAKIPILYIRTDELEMIEQLLWSGRLVTPLVFYSDREKGAYGYVPATGDVPLSDIVNLHRSLPIAKGGERTWDWADSKPRSGRSQTFPQLMVARAPSNDASSTYAGLTRYVEDFVRDRDDNSALRCSAIVLYGQTNKLPEHLLPYTELIDVDLPEKEEILALIDETMDDFGITPFEDARERLDLSSSLLGFSCAQIKRLLKRILSADEEDGEGLIYRSDRVREIIRTSKEQLLKGGDVLELVEVHAGGDEIGGMARLIGWLDEQKDLILQAGEFRREFGGSCPKGVLVCGIPGCGKSLAAETLGKKLEIPLIKLDVGRLMGHFVGESEHNMLQALKLAEAMSPCILWIDELDKGFSGAGSGGSEDSGVFKRMFGSLLTWMQDNEKPCFLFATANNIAGMPKEFFRSGRFDALFSMYMPTYTECVEILRKRMERAASIVRREEKRELFNEACYSSYTLERIMDVFCSAETAGEAQGRFVTGADLQKIVNTALNALFRQSIGKNAAQKDEIHPDEWMDAVCGALKQTTVYADGTENLDSIAATYIRLLRNNFLPSSAETLFAPDEYHAIYDESGTIKSVTIDKKPEAYFAHAYDRRFYELIHGRMEQLAPVIEQMERRRLIG